ncbi:MAG: adenylyl-sulfate kinase, partial [Caldilineaceae bacterium]|nr:adenylyl-sulfate kinase [Caldilineaceae bacterium]
MGNEFDVNLCWMDTEPMDPRTHYVLKHTTNKVKAYISGISYRIDVNTLHRQETDRFGLNEIGRVAIRTARPIFFDNYRVNHGTGSFILIDPMTNRTVAAGMIRGKSRDVEQVMRTQHKASRTSTNVRWEGGVVSAADWEKRNGHKGAVLWCTGLSGSGKSTVAKGLVKQLFGRGCQVMMLDG